MAHLSLIVFLAFVLLVGCAPANITSAKWDTGSVAGNTQVRCEQVDMRHKQEMEKVFPKYDGWKFIYISEYTTGNRLGTDAVVCFERVVAK